MDDVLWRLCDVHLRGARGPRLQDISLSLGPGVTAVLGASGAGKTSLLNLLVNFESPDSGTVIPALPDPGSRLPLYWVPQNHGLWPHLTVQEHLEAVAPPPARTPVAELLDAFDLGARADIRPDRLAEGERARLSVARALAAGAAVLVMDEPLVHVDPARLGRYWEVIRAHIQAAGASLVFATHSPRRVLAEAGVAVCLEAGRCTYCGDVESLYLRPATGALAACLGEGNWFEAEEAHLWLGREAAVFLRPEHLAVAPEPSSPLEVRACRFQGVVSELDLEHVETRACRRFFHRGALPDLKAGIRVKLKVLLGVLVLALLGCGDAAGPELVMREVRHHMLPPDGARLPAPRSLAVGPGDEVVVLDSVGRVLVLDPGGKVLRWWRMPDTRAGRPEGVCVLADGRIVVCDTHYHRVLVFRGDGCLLKSFGKEGRGPGDFLYPVAVTVDDRGNLYVCEYGSNDRVQKFDGEGRWRLAFGRFGTGPEAFQRPSGVDSALALSTSRSSSMDSRSGPHWTPLTLKDP